MSYKEDLAIKIATGNSCELVALQYQALIENVQDLGKYINQNDKEKTFATSDKIRDILSNLIATLGDDNNDFKNASIDLYLYINRVVNNAVIKKDTSEISSVIKIFETLRDAWYSAGANMSDKNEHKNLSKGITYGKTDVNISGSTSDLGRG
ncbi:MAG: flagellar export chaperone FliS [Peptoanaerobacter stomatis]|uniref:flagellar export chaperone FliS n=1 Tax=Peptoanaerobacter stomatis TaxID=796937 RepID=UPI003FA0F21B